MTDLATALSALQKGELVVVPTDTVYGIAAIPSLPSAVEAIFTAKGRPEAKPLPILGRDVTALQTVAQFDERALELAARFWPGPLTLVLPRDPTFDHDLGGDDRTTVAVRVPRSEITRELLGSSGPLAVTSANRSSEPPARTADEARSVFGNGVAVYIDGGPSAGEPSTVLSLVDAPRILRSGAVTSDDLMALL